MRSLLAGLDSTNLGLCLQFHACAVRCAVCLLNLTKFTAVQSMTGISEPRVTGGGLLLPDAETFAAHRLVSTPTRRSCQAAFGAGKCTRAGSL